MSAAEALHHPWLAAAESELRTQRIDIEVLKSMQRFAACSTIQRAALGRV